MWRWRAYSVCSSRNACALSDWALPAVLMLRSARAVLASVAVRAPRTGTTWYPQLLSHAVDIIDSARIIRFAASKTAISVAACLLVSTASATACTPFSVGVSA
ncbi:hypothetical protein GCM10023161_42530 [Mycobacterium paraffinicum]|uniref:Secreted protein n=1 Tax=Mycobacterium paraffinicum TaxID=53378 RepID=A0ABP8F3M2_9MYCO